ncbi:MAG: TetR/AcrR family transcriptional regulator [Actinobacteria bacterium]|nr:TetR/AcrR family transcriptional regulator [Actinomycetota bacterium]
MTAAATRPPAHDELSRVRARNRRRILGAVTDLIESTGIDDASMRQIADAAEVSVRTLYNLFGDKQGLLRALVHESVDEVDLAVGRVVATDPVERTWEVVEVAFRTVTTSLSRAVLRPVLTDDELLVQLAQRWQVQGLMVDEIARAQRTGELLDDLGAEELVDQVGPILLHLLRSWAAGAIDDDALVAGALRALDLCLLAVAPPDQRARLLAHLDVLADSAGDARVG